MKSQVLLTEHIIFVLMLLILIVGAYGILTSIDLKTDYGSLKQIYTREKSMDLMGAYSKIYLHYPLNSNLRSSESYIEQSNNLTIYVTNK